MSVCRSKQIQQNQPGDLPHRCGVGDHQGQHARSQGLEISSDLARQEALLLAKTTTAYQPKQRDSNSKPDFCVHCCIILEWHNGGCFLPHCDCSIGGRARLAVDQAIRCPGHQAISLGTSNKLEAGGHGQPLRPRMQQAWPNKSCQLPRIPLPSARSTFLLVTPHSCPGFCLALIPANRCFFCICSKVPVDLTGSFVGFQLPITHGWPTLPVSDAIIIAICLRIVTCCSVANFQDYGKTFHQHKCVSSIDTYLHSPIPCGTVSFSRSLRFRITLKKVCQVYWFPQDSEAYSSLANLNMKDTLEHWDFLKS